MVINIKFRYLGFIIIITALFLTVASVSAEDLNQTEMAIDDAGSDYAPVLMEEDNNDEISLSSDANESDVLQAANSLEASFSDVEDTNYVKGETFSVKLLDENKNGIANKAVYFTIDGKLSNSTTDKDGNAKLKLNVDKGAYTVKYSFNGSGYKSVTSSKDILVVTTTASKIKASDFTAYLTVISYFKVTLTVDDIPLAGREIKFTINGRNYTNKTNSKGNAYLAIGLYEGSYAVKYSFDGEDNIKKCTGQSKVTVKKMPKVISKLNSPIFRHKTLNKFKIKLTDAKGKALKNKKVTFTINKRKYVRVTDKDGIATLDVKLKKGTYKFKVYSGKTSLYNKVSKTYTVKVKPKYTRNNGIWLLSTDMKQVNFNKLEKYGTKHIFLNAKSIERWGQTYVEEFIQDANDHDIKVHIWMQVFFKGGKWVKPIKNGKIDYKMLKSKVKLAKKYAKIKGISGVHFDYLRFPGTAYKYKGGVKAVNYFTKHASAGVHKVNKNLIVSAALMPEPSSMKHYYGQDISAMSKHLDVMVPMAYKGNYHAGTNWIKQVTKIFVKKSKGAKVWTGIQTYKSDADWSRRSASSLMNDADAAAMGGARGVILFRFGLANFFDFNKI